MKVLQSNSSSNILIPNNSKPILSVPKYVSEKHIIKSKPILPAPTTPEEYDPAISSNTVIYPSNPINDFEGFLKAVFWGSIKGDIKNLKDLIDYINNNFSSVWGKITGNIESLKDLIEYILNNSHAGKSEWGFINGDITNQIDLINYLISNNIKYSNLYIPEDKNINDVKKALDYLLDKEFYRLPDPVNVTFNVEAFRKGVRINSIYDGMIIDKLIYRWTINNYLNNIESVLFDKKVISEDYAVLEGVFISDISKNLTVTSNKVDSKNNRPKPFSLNKGISFSKKYYYTTNSISFGTIPPNLKDDASSGGKLSIVTNGEEYIYLLLPKEYNTINIFEHGTPNPGGDVTDYIGMFKYKEFDRDIPYYLYRSTNALNGTWDVIYK